MNICIIGKIFYVYSASKIDHVVLYQAGHGLKQMIFYKNLRTIRLHQN